MNRLAAAWSSIDWPSLTAIDLGLIVTLVPLLGTLAFFSFVETTFFALTPAERLALRRSSPKCGTATGG